MFSPAPKFKSITFQCSDFFMVQLSHPYSFPSKEQVSFNLMASVTIHNDLAFCIRWPKYWSFSISPSNEYSGLISFKTDRFDLLAVQGTLKYLLQHYSSKVSTLWYSVFFKNHVLFLSWASLSVLEHINTH